MARLASARDLTRGRFPMKRTNTIISLKQGASIEVVASGVASARRGIHQRRADHLINVHVSRHVIDVLSCT